MQSVRQSSFSEWKGAWVLVVLLFMPPFEYRFGPQLEAHVRQTLDVPDDGSLGQDPPFYYLRGEFVEGVCSAVFAAVGFLFAAATWKWCQPYSGVAFWMIWLHHMPGAVDALIVYWRCPHLLDAEKAISGWKTFEEALNDPLRDTAHWVTASLAVLFACLVMWRWRCNQSSDAAGATHQTIHSPSTVPNSSRPA